MRKHIAIIFIFLLVLYGCSEAHVSDSGLENYSSENITSSNSSLQCSGIENVKDWITFNNIGDSYPEIKKYYHKEFSDAESLGAFFDLFVGEYDLNDDGTADYILVFEGVLYGGSSGNRTEVLIKNAKGDFDEISIGFGFDPTVMKTKTNGLYDFAFSNNDYKTLYKYEGSTYYAAEISSSPVSFESIADNSQQDKLEEDKFEYPTWFTKKLLGFIQQKFESFSGPRYNLSLADISDDGIPEVFIGNHAAWNSVRVEYDVYDIQTMQQLVFIKSVYLYDGKNGEVQNDIPMQIADDYRYPLFRGYLFVSPSGQNYYLGIVRK